jgi:hypothetical protein
MKEFCWIVTILACIIAGFALIATIFDSSGAPQQAAGAAIAAAVAIIPYVFSRAVTELSESKMEKQNEQILKLLSGLHKKPEHESEQLKA